MNKNVVYILELPVPEPLRWERNSAESWAVDL